MEPKLMIDNEFSRKLGNLRRNKGYTQDDMSTRLQLKGINISRGTYAKIESGLRHVTFEQLSAIREILGTSWDELFRL